MVYTEMSIASPKNCIIFAHVITEAVETFAVAAECWEVTKSLCDVWWGLSGMYCKKSQAASSVCYASMPAFLPPSLRVDKTDKWKNYPHGRQTIIKFSRTLIKQFSKLLLEFSLFSICIDNMTISTHDISKHHLNRVNLNFRMCRISMTHWQPPTTT